MGAARQNQLAIRQRLLFRPLLGGQLLRLGVYPKDLGVRVQFHLQRFGHFLGGCRYQLLGGSLLGVGIGKRRLGVKVAAI